MNDSAPRPAEIQQPRWRPLSAIDRRIVGVLVEKAKTTPDQYPMSANALRSGCNQKNNRYPLMELEAEDIDDALQRLRDLGAAAEVQGGGRVSRYRHYLYEWLGVDKIELAVMTELLLRGAQTEGELRGRAARMEPIPDLNVLRTVLGSLEKKGLVISLTPEGRGHVVTHALYEPRELQVRARIRIERAAARLRCVNGTPTASCRGTASAPHAGQPVTVHQDALAPAAQGAAGGAAAPIGHTYASSQAVDQLRNELLAVRAEVAALRKDLDDLWSNFR